jgi:hypothetical protein
MNKTEKEATASSKGIEKTHNEAWLSKMTSSRLDGCNVLTLFSLAMMPEIKVLMAINLHVVRHLLGPQE